VNFDTFHSQLNRILVMIYQFRCVWLEFLNRTFCKQNKRLNDITFIIQDNEFERRVVLLYGLGGIRKTQLAVAFFSERRNVLSDFFVRRARMKTHSFGGIARSVQWIFIICADQDGSEDEWRWEDDRGCQSVALTSRKFQVVACNWQC